jgi:hypothetical protein
MPLSPTIHEIDFCAQMAGAINQVVGQNPAVYPFHEARIEGFGSGRSRRKRKDLRFFDLDQKLVLCGEVKLPGKPDGQSAMSQGLVDDAAAKAEEAGIQYFFTWNVNEFAIWDRSLWDRPWFEKRVKTWRLQRTMVGVPAALARATAPPAIINACRLVSTSRSFIEASGTRGIFSSFVHSPSPAACKPNNAIPSPTQVAR